MQPDQIMILDKQPPQRFTQTHTADDTCGAKQCLGLVYIISLYYFISFLLPVGCYFVVGELNHTCNASQGCERG